jgi:GNAT superfamily N-acetyltransferase
MTEPTATEPGAQPSPAGWSIREAAESDASAVAAAVAELLVELGGRRPSPTELEDEVRAVCADPAQGVIFLAEAEGAVVGVLAASWQRAMHVPGRYATIQDLWVDGPWRSRGVGAELIETLARLCRADGVARIEVGLPRETFAAIAKTVAFYGGAGFEPLGPRMRRVL